MPIAAWRWIVRLRYVWVAVTASLVALYFVSAGGPGKFNDWVLFEAAARSLVHYHHIAVYAGNPLGLYARLPTIQIGPPAILPVAALQWLSPWTVSRIFVAVMVGLGFFSVVAAELIGRTGGRPTVRDVAAPAALVGGLIIVVDWSWCAMHWHHLDDAMALSFTVFACLLIVQGRLWWLVGLLIGTAMAAKPWALIFAPVFLGLPREVRSKAILVALGSAAAWWAPFVIGGPGTISALGGYHIEVQNGSVLRLLGIHGDVQHWLRPVQWLGGIGAGLLVARLGGRTWLAAPLAALAIRVLTDPFSWGYYGMGPILFALVWDLTRPNANRIPIYTLATAAVEGLAPKLIIVNLLGPMSGKAYLLGELKLAWGLGILLALTIELWGHRQAGADTAPAPEPEPASEPVMR